MKKPLSDLAILNGANMTYLESVYQKDFKTILKEKILQPLDMTETSVANNLDIIPQMTNGYHFVTENRLV